MLDSLLNKIRTLQAGLQSGEIIRAAVLPFGEDVLNLQREQLAEGKASSGEDIRPYYSEDLKPSGYFRSTATAANYAAWKQDLGNPYGGNNRNPDAPNLYIVGKFYDELGVEFGTDSVAVVPRSGFASGIMAKYGSGTFGLMMSNWYRIFAEKGAYLRLMNEVKRKLYE